MMLLIYVKPHWLPYTDSPSWLRSTIIYSTSFKWTLVVSTSFYVHKYITQTMYLFRYMRTQCEINSSSKWVLRVMMCSLKQEAFLNNEHKTIICYQMLIFVAFNAWLSYKLCWSFIDTVCVFLWFSDFSWEEVVLLCHKRKTCTGELVHLDVFFIVTF